MTVSRKLKPLTPVSALTIEVFKMYNKVGLDVPNLCRKFAPYFRTLQIGNIFFLTFKHSGITLKCTPEPLLNGVGYVHITTSKNPDAEYQFYINSNKELMQKIIKHELI